MTETFNISSILYNSSNILETEYIYSDYPSYLHFPFSQITVKLGQIESKTKSRNWVDINRPPNGKTY